VSQLRTKAKDRWNLRGRDERRVGTSGATESGTLVEDLELPLGNIGNDVDIYSRNGGGNSNGICDILNERVDVSHLEFSLGSEGEGARAERFKVVKAAKIFMSGRNAASSRNGNKALFCQVRH
jgi:hypothetical protein